MLLARDCLNSCIIIHSSKTHSFILRMFPRAFQRTQQTPHSTKLNELWWTGRKFTFHDSEVPLEEGPSDLLFLLVIFGLLCEEFGHDPTVNSSLLLELKHPASSTPIGLWGTNGADLLLPKLAAQALINDKSLISSRHFRTLSCKMKNPLKLKKDRRTIPTNTIHQLNKDKTKAKASLYLPTVYVMWGTTPPHLLYNEEISHGLVKLFCLQFP